MVLIANEVMQEGLDLHRACRRVVHHDLPWNPAQLEQRVGRVDRIGSRIRQLLPRDPKAKLTVLFPLIHQTIDTRIHGVVRAREKWPEFLLGARPPGRRSTRRRSTPSRHRRYRMLSSSGYALISVLSPHASTRAA